MKKSRFTEEQMVSILREADSRPVAEVAKRHGVSKQTIYSWCKRYGTLETADVRRLRLVDPYLQSGTSDAGQGGGSPSHFPTETLIQSRFSCGASCPAIFRCPTA